MWYVIYLHRQVRSRCTAQQSHTEHVREVQTLQACWDCIIWTRFILCIGAVIHQLHICVVEVPESREFISTPSLLSQPGIVKLNDFTKKRESLSLEWGWEHRVSFMIKDNVYLHRVLPKCSLHVEHSKQWSDLIRTFKLALRFFVGFCERRVHKLTSFVDFNVGKTNNFLESFIRDHQSPGPIYNIKIVFGLTIWTSNCWQNLEWSYSRTLGVEVLYKW